VPAVTKQHLIQEVARTTGVSQADTRLATEAFLSTVSDLLVARKTMELRGFGTFLVKIRKARPARNPKTGEVVQLKMRSVPLLKFSAELKKRVFGVGNDLMKPPAFLVRQPVQKV